MRWWKRNSPTVAPVSSPEAAPSLREELADLRAELKALARDVDDLDETLRSVRGRIAKKQGLDDAAAVAPVAVAPVSRGMSGPRRPLDSLAIRRGGGGGPAAGG